MTTLAVVISLLIGIAAGVLVQRAAARFVPGQLSAGAGGEGGPESRTVAVRTPPAVTVAATALLCGAAGLRFGATWQLPAFLLLAAVGALVAVIDLEHRLLPDRIVLPAIAAATVLLTAAAVAGHDWTRLRGAVVGAVGLFLLFLVLALIAPAELGMGDVKLAALLGLHLGWLGGSTLVGGALAGFVVQALLAVALLLTRRIGLGSELPFGPAMLAGAAIVLGGTGSG